MNAVAQWKLEKRKMLTIQFYFPHLEIPFITGDNMAERAVEMLLQGDSNDGNPVESQVSPLLIVRESTQALRVPI